MKRALIITYYWPPSGGSGVQRWVKFTRYLPQLGWQPVIYTPSNPEYITTDDSLAAEIPAEAEIVKTRIVEPYNLYRKFTGARSFAEVNPFNTTDRSLKHRFSMWIRANLFIPDPRFLWVRPSVKFLKRYVREHPVDVIVSTAPPQSMHLIARNLARKTGLPWVADFRDPWTKMFTFKELPLTHASLRKHLRLESSVIREASVVIAVTPLVAHDFEEMGAKRVEILTNGYDTADYRDLPEPESDGFFNLTHTGLFASEGNPDTLWRCLEQKAAEDPAFRERLRIRLAGKTDPRVKESIAACGLADAIVDLGYITHAQAVSEQLSASIGLLPLRKDPELRKTYPGKIFELMASGRPVMGFGQSDSVSAQLLQRTGTGAMYDWDDEKGMRAFIDREWERFSRGDTARRVNPEVEKEFSREGLCTSLVKILESL